MKQTFVVSFETIKHKSLKKNYFIVYVQFYKHLPGVGKVRGSNRVIVNDVKSCTYCCYVRCASLIVWIGWMPRRQTGAIQYYALLGFPGKGRVIKRLVLCYEVWLGPMKMISLKTWARYVLCRSGCYWSQVSQQPLEIWQLNKL